MLTEEEKAAAAKEEAEKKAADADKALEERINKTVNSALTSHLKRIKAGITAEDLEKHLEEREKALAERREKEEEERRKKEGGGDKHAPELVSLKKQNEELRKRLDSLDKEAAQAKEEKKAAEERSLLAEMLAEGGVKDARVRHAVNYLRGEGLVRRTDKGELVFVKRARGGDEELDLGEGIAEWLKTEDGKHFLPPTNAGGAGTETRRKAGGRNANDQETPKARAAAALAALRAGGG